MINDKVKSIAYGVAMVAALANAYFAWRGGNFDAAIAWFAAGGMAGGACAVYSELHNLKSGKDGEV